MEQEDGSVLIDDSAVDKALEGLDPAAPATPDSIDKIIENSHEE